MNLNPKSKIQNPPSFPYQPIRPDAVDILIVIKGYGQIYLFKIIGNFTQGLYRDLLHGDVPAVTGKFIPEIPRITAS